MFRALLAELLCSLFQQTIKRARILHILHTHNTHSYIQRSPPLESIFNIHICTHISNPIQHSDRIKASTLSTTKFITLFPIWDNYLIMKKACSLLLLNTSKHTHTNTPHTHCRFTAHCPGLPGWAGTRRGIHPLTHEIILRPLSASSICHDS